MATSNGLYSFTLQQQILHLQFIIAGGKPPAKVECFYDRQKMYIDLSNLAMKDINKEFIFQLIEEAEKKSVENLIISVSKSIPDFSIII